MMKRTTFYAASAGCGSCGLGEDAVTPKTCRFYSHTKSDEAEAVQKTLRLMGATGIKADGLWGACSESAYAKVFDEILTSASLEKNFGIKCSKVDKVFAGSKTCKDGSDAIQPGYTDAPPQDDYVGPTTPALPGGHTTPAVFSRLPLTATSRLAVSKAQTSPKLASALLRPRTDVENALSSGQQTLIPGVPNLVVTIGGIALLGVAGWFAYGAMTKGGGSVKRNGQNLVDDDQIIDILQASGHAYEYEARSGSRGLRYTVAADPNAEYVDESPKTYALRPVIRGGKVYYDVSKIPFLRK